MFKTRGVKGRAQTGHLCSHVVRVGMLYQWCHLTPKPISLAVTTALTFGGNTIWSHLQNIGNSQLSDCSSNMNMCQLDIIY